MENLRKANPFKSVLYGKIEHLALHSFSGFSGFEEFI